PPNVTGPIVELPRTGTDDVAGEWIDWDGTGIGYSGWNMAEAERLGEDTGGASDELLGDDGGSYVRLAERLAELDRFETRLGDITQERLRRKCTALVAGCREALMRDPNRAILLVF